MAQVTKKNTFTAGTKILSAQVNENFNDIYNEFNGNIDNDNVKNGAGITDNKLAQITSAGKVDASTALTGLIPSANQDVVLALSIAASAVATDAELATIFTVTLTEDITLSNPTNAVDGMKRIWRFKQDGTGFWTVTLDTNFRVSQEIGTFAVKADPSDITYIGAIYNGDDSKWDIVAYGSRLS